MKTLKEVGYPHMVIPDHAPGARQQAYTYPFGYIKALLQAVEH